MMHLIAFAFTLALALAQLPAPVPGDQWQLSDRSGHTHTGAVVGEHFTFSPAGSSLGMTRSIPLRNIDRVRFDPGCRCHVKLLDGTHYDGVVDGNGKLGLRGAGGKEVDVWLSECVVLMRRQ